MRLEDLADKLETSEVCVLCKGDKRILSFQGGIKTVPCWLCQGTGERKLLALQVAFLLKVEAQMSKQGQTFWCPDCEESVAADDHGDCVKCSQAICCWSCSVSTIVRHGKGCSRNS